MDLTRKCPNCQKEIVYKNKKNLTKAEKRNSKCHECKYDDNFKKKISETTKIAMWRPEIREKFLEENAKIDCSKQTKKYFQEYFKDENNKIKYRERCKKAYENMPEETKEKIKKASSKAHKGKAHTQEQRELISERMRGIKNPFYGKTHSEETKKILRDKTLKQMEINGGFFKYTPMFNRKACDFFDFLNKNLGWKGQHALTENGEYVVPNYFYYLDYYEPNLNLVIEWDEEPHYSCNKLREKDIERQQRIIECLGCTFVRIREKTFEITIINQEEFYE